MGPPPRRPLGSANLINLRAQSNGDTTLKRPLDVLKQALNERVIVALRGGREYRGTLTGYDPHLNLVLTTAEELEEGRSMRHLSKAILRGDNVVYISP